MTKWQLSVKIFIIYFGFDPRLSEAYMTTRPLIKPRSAYTKRRLIILFLLSTIIAVSVMTGFSSGLNSDSNIYTADGERIVMWQDLPQSGTPEDYDLISNVQFAAQRIYLSPYFRGQTTGKVIANVGMGIKYTQNVNNTRVVKGNKIFVEAISSSSLKSVAEQRYYVGDNVFLRPSTSISGGNATFAGSVSKFEKEDYYKAYGVIPNELTKLYIDNSTILSVRDDNATKARMAAKNAADGAEEETDGAALTFDVPQALVPDGDGNFSVTLELDPAESTKYSRNEVRTLAGADQNPYYYSSSVTIKFTSEWKPISVTTVDNYDIAIPVLGAMNCSTTMTEVFSDIDDENGELPEQEFFESHIGDIDPDAPPITQTASPADYLASAFAAYLDGSKNLELEADIAIGSAKTDEPVKDPVKIDDLALSVNIGTMDIRAKLGKLAVEYTNNKVYITLNDIKGYLSVDKFTSLIKDPTLSSLLGGVTSKLPDLDNLFGDDILATVFAACEMKTDKGVTCIRLPFTLAEGIDIDASLYIKDEGMELVGISGTVKALGLEIKLNAVPKAAAFPKIDDTYKCLDGALDFIPDAINTINSSTYGISGTIKFNDYSLDVDAYIERDDDGITVDATVRAFGLNIGIKYVGGEIYVTLGNIAVHATMQDLPAIKALLSEFGDFDLKAELGIDKLEELLNIEIDLENPETLKKLLPQTVTEWIAAVRSLEVTENSFDLGVRLATMPISIGLTREGGKLSGAKLGVDLVVFDKVSKFSADLDIDTPQKKQIAPPSNYVELDTLLGLIPTVKEVIAAKALSGVASLTIDGATFNANVAVDFNDGLKVQITEDTLGIEAVIIAPSIADLTSATIYVKVANIKVYGSIADIKSLLDAISPALPENAGEIIDTAIGFVDADMPSFTDMSTVMGLIDKVLGMIRSVTQTQNGIAAEIVVGETAIDIELATDLSSVEIGTTALGKEIGITLDAITFTAPKINVIDGAVCIKEFVPVIDAVLPLIDSKGFELGISGTLAFGDENTLDSKISGSVKIALPRTVETEENGETVTTVLPLGIEADVTIADVALGIIYDGQNIFLDIDNKHKFSCTATKDGITALIADIKGAIADLDKNGKIAEKLDDVADVISKPIDIDIMSLLNDITLTHADGTDGVSYLTLGYKGIRIKLGSDGELCSLGLDFNIGGKEISLSTKIGTDAESGAIESIGIKYDFVSLTLTLDRNDNVSISKPDSKQYTDIRSLIGYIKPIANLVVKAKDAKTISLDIAAKLTFASGKYLDIASRDLTIAFGKKADASGKEVPFVNASGDIVLFAGTGIDSETVITITFVNNIVYIKVGGIAVKLDITTNKATVTDNNTTTDKDAVTDNGAAADNVTDADKDIVTDIDKLYNILASYLPDYLDKELQKLLGKSEGASAFSDVSLIIEKITTVATAKDAKSALKTIFGGYGGLTSDSTLKKLLGMISLSTANDTLGLGADLGLIYVSANTVISSGELVGVNLATNIFGIDVSATANNLVLSPIETAITDPSESASYVSIVDFVEMIDNLVGTFTQHMTIGTTGSTTGSTGTTTDGTGTTTDGSTGSTDDTTDNTSDEPITFEISKLNFTYSEKGTNGISVTVNSMAGQSALKGKITPHEVVETVEKDGVAVTTKKTEYSVALEMHISLNISTIAKKWGTLGLELYLVDNYPSSPLAYLNYTEFYGDEKKNIGELVSIDADSVLQILAAAMDIIGVDDATVEKLLGDYRQKEISTKIFDSMDIIGLDPLKSLLDGFVKAIDEVKSALFDAQNALNTFNTAGSMNNLRSKLGEIKQSLSSAINHIKSAIEAFGINLKKKDDAPAQPDSGAITGEKVKSVTDGITFKRGVGTISADIDNSLTTGATGKANITVSETASTITGIDIKNLDVNTALIGGNIAFVSGQDVEFSAIPPTTPSYSTYSDLANIKHLLFDVMNTADIKEFHIGGYDTSDSIGISLDLKNIEGGALLQYLAKLDISIKYDIKVKVIDTGELDKNGNTIYKTAAVVELFYENCTAQIFGADAVVVPDCTTRLYFYDNVLYVQGISDWGKKKEVDAGSVDINYTARRGKIGHKYDVNQDFTVDYKVDTNSYFDRVNVMYTVDELFYMIKTDTSKFLNEFLFYLVPLSKDFSIGVNLQEEIVKLIPSPDSSAKPTENTVARAFKGYSYTDISKTESKHSLTLGLKEITGSATLSDLIVDIVGVNDGDDGTLLNNYISKLNVKTSIQDGLVTVTLGATLNNVIVENNTAKSEGFAPTDVTTKNATFDHNGKTYVIYSNFEYDTLYTLDGTVYAANDGKSLFVDHGKLVEVHRAASGSDNYSYHSTKGWTLTCDFDKPDELGYKTGDLEYLYKYVCKLENCYDLYDKYNYTYYVGSTDNKKYVYRQDGNNSVKVKVKSVIDDLLAEVVTGADGKIVSVTNRDGGVEWTRKWKDVDKTPAAAA